MRDKYRITDHTEVVHTFIDDLSSKIAVNLVGYPYSRGKDVLFILCKHSLFFHRKELSKK